MKTCPECGTQYEDHVATCLVDGVDLTAVAPTAVAKSTPVSAAAAPVPAQGGGGGRAAGGVLLVVGALVVLLLVGAAGVGIFAVVVSTGSTPPPEPKPDPVPVATPVPVAAPPVPVPVPLPDPVGEDGPTITLTSEPSGAEVWEGSSKLCMTPCTTAHPEHAPLPREFVIKMDGYIDKTYSMEDPAAEHMVRLSRPQRVKPTPGPRLPKIDTER